MLTLTLLPLVVLRSYHGSTLPNDKKYDQFEFKEFEDNKLNITKKLKFVLGKSRKQCRKRRKCWLPAFSPFPTMFSRGLFIRVVKSKACVVKI